MTHRDKLKSTIKNFPIISIRSTLFSTFNSLRLCVNSAASVELQRHNKKKQKRERKKLLKSFAQLVSLINDVESASCEKKSKSLKNTSRLKKFLFR